MRLLENLSPREESMFHVMVRISSVAYDVECKMEMGLQVPLGY